MIPFQTEILVTIGMFVAFYLGVVYEAHQQKLDEKHYQELLKKAEKDRAAQHN